MPTVELAAGTIEDQDAGGGPVVVLLHGPAMNGSLWRHVFRELGGDRRCVVPMLPLGGHRRLQVRYERRADILLGFLQLACALICLKFLNRPAGWRKPPTEAGDALSAPSR